MIDYGDTLFEDFDLSGYDTTEYKPYLHYFDTNSEFEEEYFGDEYYEPWVSFTSGDSLVHYNKKSGQQYLTMVVKSATNGSLLWGANDSSMTGKTIQYRLNDGEWTNLTSTQGGVGITINTGDVIRFRGDNSAYGKLEGVGPSAELKCSRFYVPAGANYEIELRGNVMSLLNSTNFTGLTSLTTTAVFAGLFSGNTAIVSAKRLALPATHLSERCYWRLFAGCTKLTNSPELPATGLAVSCYESMFAGCTSLTTPPKLPATTLAMACYASMFSGCRSMTYTPELSTSDIAPYCYWSMFENCTSLTTSSRIKLPAMTLPQDPVFGGGCYWAMFKGCTSLTDAPDLPATIISKQCYTGMFLGCASLTHAPSVLPALKNMPQCYFGMFSGCTSLVNAPEILATGKSEFECYSDMFNGCTSLVNGPSSLSANAWGDDDEGGEQPSASIHWAYMFKNCTSLVNAPELIIEDSDLTHIYSLNEMFYGCANLSHIKAHFKPRSPYTDRWVSGVSSTGTFEIPSSLVSSVSYGVNAVPNGWTVVGF